MMGTNQLPLLHKGIYAIAGLSKNAGKTSFLNWLIAQQHLRMGILTTGHDGEATDAVFGNAKPSVLLPPDTLFTTTAEVLNRHASALRIIRSLPYKAGKQPLWLASTTTALHTEVWGTGSTEAGMDIADIMRSEGAELILIDGSLDRKSVAMCEGISGVFLVAGASAGKWDEVNTELTRLHILSSIKAMPIQSTAFSHDKVMLGRDGIYTPTALSSLFNQENTLIQLISEQKPDTLFLPGALTDTSFRKLFPILKDVQHLIITHPLHLHLSHANLQKLLTTCDTRSLLPYTLLGVAVNCWSVSGMHQDSAQMRSQIRSLLPHLPVWDVCEALPATHRNIVNKELLSHGQR